MQKVHFLKKKQNKNLICYLFDFFTLEEKIQKMRINRIFFNALKEQKIYKELRILNIELMKFKGVVLGILLDNNAKIFTKIVKNFELDIPEDILANWLGRWINKFYFESKILIN